MPQRVSGDAREDGAMKGLVTIAIALVALTFALVAGYHQHQRNEEQIQKLNVIIEGLTATPFQGKPR